MYKMYHITKQLLQYLIKSSQHKHKLTNWLKKGDQVTDEYYFFFNYIWSSVTSIPCINSDEYYLHKCTVY